MAAMSTTPSAATGEDGPGTLTCFGAGHQGSTDPPTDIGPVYAVTIHGHGCAITADKTVKCWGTNSQYFDPIPTDLGTVVKIAMGDEHTCALTEASTVKCWGRDGYGQASVPSDLGTVLDFDSGAWQNCAVQGDSASQSAGPLKCWGLARDRAGMPTSGNFKKVACGFLWNCALKDDDTLQCFGDTIHGGSPPTGTYLDVVISTKTACALTMSGTVTCFGGNLPTDMSALSAWTNVVSVDVESSQICALSSSSVLSCVGDTPTPSGLDPQKQFSVSPNRGVCTVSGTVADPAAGAAASTTMQSSGQAGSCADNDFRPGLVPKNGNTPTPTGRKESLAECVSACKELDPDGSITVPETRGASFDCLCGEGRETSDQPLAGWVYCYYDADPSTTAPVGGDLQGAVSTTPRSGQDEPGTLTCFGDGHQGNINPATNIGPVYAVTIQSHGCAVTADRTVRCWGDVHNSIKTVPTDLGRVVKFAMGAEHTCALTEASTVKCWGRDAYRQSTVPSDLGAVIDFDSGAWQNCAIQRGGTSETAGTLKCWGYSTDLTGWNNVVGNVKKVACGWQGSCVLKEDDTLQCFGRGAPTPPTGTYRDVVMNQQAACAVTMSGTVTCFWNHVPADTSALTDVVYLSVNNHVVCAISSNSALTCVGRKSAPASLGPQRQVSVGAGEGVCTVSGDASMVLTTAAPPTPGPPQANVALQRPTASSSFSEVGHHGYFAVDGVSDTHWQAYPEDGQWLAVDLQSEYNVASVEVEWLHRYALNYRIEGSLEMKEPQNWTTFATASGASRAVQSNDLPPGSRARWLRIFCVDRNGFYGCAITDMKVFTQDPVPASTAIDLALNRPTLESSHAEDYVSKLAVDGISSTRWSSKYKDGEWLAVDLGKEKLVERVEVVWETSYGEWYKFEGSNEETPTTWTTLAESPGKRGPTAIVTYLPLNTTTRWIRMYGVSRGYTAGFSMFDFRVMGEGPREEVVVPTPAPAPAACGSTSDLTSGVVMRSGGADPISKGQVTTLAQCVNTCKLDDPDGSIVVSSTWPTVNYCFCGGTRGSQAATSSPGHKYCFYGAAAPTPSPSLQASGAGAWFKLELPEEVQFWVLYENGVYRVHKGSKTGQLDSDGTFIFTSGAVKLSDSSTGRNQYPMVAGDCNSFKLTGSSTWSRVDATLPSWWLAAAGCAAPTPSPPTQAIVNGAWFKLKAPDGYDMFYVLSESGDYKAYKDSKTGALQDTGTFTASKGTVKLTDSRSSTYETPVADDCKSFSLDYTATKTLTWSAVDLPLPTWWLAATGCAVPTPSPPTPAPSQANPYVGKDCWLQCSKKSGYCPVCGPNGGCCRKNFAADAAECKTATYWPIVGHHRCVQLAAPTAWFKVNAPDGVQFWALADGAYKAHDGSKTGRTLQEGTFTASKGTASFTARSSTYPANVTGDCTSFVVSGLTFYAADSTLPSWWLAATGCAPTISNLALNRPTIHSSEYNSQGKSSFAVDGDMDTRWESAWKEPEWMAVDLGHVSDIDRVEVHWEGAYAAKYHIEGSNEASPTSWSRLNCSVAGKRGLVVTKMAPGVQARWIRLYGADRATGYGVSLYELEVYGARAANSTSNASSSSGSATCSCSASCSSGATKPSTSGSTCSASHPYAFNPANGLDRCCKSGRNKAGADCANSRDRWCRADSCEGDDYVLCGKPPCTDHSSAVKCNRTVERSCPSTHPHAFNPNREWADCCASTESRNPDKPGQNAGPQDLRDHTCKDGQYTSCPGGKWCGDYQQCYPEPTPPPTPAPVQAIVDGAWFFGSLSGEFYGFSEKGFFQGRRDSKTGRLNYQASGTFTASKGLVILTIGSKKYDFTVGAECKSLNHTESGGTTFTWTQVDPTLPSWWLAATGCAPERPFAPGNAGAGGAYGGYVPGPDDDKVEVKLRIEGVDTTLLNLDENSETKAKFIEAVKQGIIEAASASLGAPFAPMWMGLTILEVERRLSGLSLKLLGDRARSLQGVASGDGAVTVQTDIVPPGDVKAEDLAIALENDAEAVAKKVEEQVATVPGLEKIQVAGTQLKALAAIVSVKEAELSVQEAAVANLLAAVEAAKDNAFNALAMGEPNITVGVPGLGILYAAPLSSLPRSFGAGPVTITLSDEIFAIESPEEGIPLVFSALSVDPAVAEALGGLAALVMDMQTMNNTEVEVPRLTVPVAMTLPVIYNDTQITCAYWDEDAKQWSRDGVRQSATSRAALEDEVDLECETFHFSLFGAILSGIVNTIACANFNLLRKESIEMLGRGDWHETLGARACFLMLGSMCVAFTMAAILDCHRRARYHWKDEFFLVPERVVQKAEAATPTTPTDGTPTTADAPPSACAKGRAACIGGCLICCAWCPMLGDAFKEALDDIISSWFEYFAEVRELCSMFAGTVAAAFENRATGGVLSALSKASDNLVTKLLVAHSRRGVAASLGMSADLVSFILEDEDLRDYISDERMYRKDKDKEERRAAAMAAASALKAAPEGPVDTAEADKAAPATNVPQKEDPEAPEAQDKAAGGGDWFFLPAYEEAKKAPAETGADMATKPSEAAPLRKTSSGLHTWREKQDQYLAWRTLRQEVCEALLTRTYKPRSHWQHAFTICEMYTFENPIGALFAVDIFQSSKQKVAVFCSDLLGSFVMCAVFFQGGGMVRGRPVGDQTEEMCSNVDDSSIGFRIGRFIVIATASLFIASLPVSLLESLMTKGFKKMAGEPGSAVWKQQLRAWKIQEAMFWVAAFLYDAFCAFYLLVFIANIANEDHEDWTLASAIGLFEDFLVFPLFLAAALPVAARLWLRFHTWTHQVSPEDMVRKACERLHSETNMMLPVEEV